jgi:predicted metal-dependent phosphoesterase TrpH
MSSEKRLIKADVHLHTCLSPCAEVTQSPKRVVEKAAEIGLDLIFITDHNSVANAEAAINAGKKYENLKIYPGMEITTREEIHILSLFENLEDAKKTQKNIDEYLPDVFYEKEKNEQILANENDEVEGFYGKSLFSSVDLGINEVIELVHLNNGLAVAAHIDRPSFSVISQLGFIPLDCRLDAIEISPNMSFGEANKVFENYLDRFKIVKGSDAHSLEAIGNAKTEFFGIENSFDSFINFIKS